MPLATLSETTVSLDILEELSSQALWYVKPVKHRLSFFSDENEEYFAAQMNGTVNRTYVFYPATMSLSERMGKEHLPISGQYIEFLRLFSICFWLCIFLRDDNKANFAVSKT